MPIIVRGSPSPSLARIASQTAEASLAAERSDKTTTGEDAADLIASMLCNGKNGASTPPPPPPPPSDD